MKTWSEQWSKVLESGKKYVQKEWKTEREEHQKYGIVFLKFNHLNNTDQTEATKSISR